jgi:DNA repair photolyase
MLLLRVDHGVLMKHSKLAAPAMRGRGAAGNPPGRFERVQYERDEQGNAADDPAPKTQFFRDHSASLITYNDSPDIPFRASINPYRGCEHGCIYCYARPYHEYLGFSAGLDFETKIVVKEDAPELLRRELSSPKWKPQTLAMSGVTDPYQPVERRLRVTRRCLEVLAEFRNPVGIVTKNHLVTRVLDVLGELARFNAAAVYISLTTLDADLARVMEPRTAQPQARLAAIRKLHDAGVPVGVMMAPLIPGLTDHEIPRLLEAAAQAGARTAGYVPLRLPHGVKDLFVHWLEQHMPDRKERVLQRIRDIRGGKLNEPNFGARMTGQGTYFNQIASLFEVSRKRFGLCDRFELSTSSFCRSAGNQLPLAL